MIVVARFARGEDIQVAGRTTGASRVNADEGITPWHPYHTHDDKQPLVPGRAYELDVEIWPMCIVLPAGFRIAVNISGKDFERPGADSNPAFRSRGSGPWLHDDRYDRPAEIFGGHTTLHTGPKRESFLLLPIVPTDRSGVQVLATHNGKNRDIA